MQFLKFVILYKVVQSYHYKHLKLHLVKFLHDGATIIISSALFEVINWVSKVSAERHVANRLSFSLIANYFVSAIVTLARVCVHCNTFLNDSVMFNYIQYT